MKAMILAAGEGRRMRPLTLHTPKPLLAVGGKPLLEHHILGLKAAGLTDLVVNAAYLGQQIVDFCGDGSRWGVTISVSSEPEPLETAGGIINALPLLGDEPFLLVNGDIWCPYPFEKLARHVSPRGGAHVVLVDNPAHNPAGDFTLTEGWLSQLESHQDGLTEGGRVGLTYSGIGVFDQGLFRGLEAGKRPLKPLLDRAIDNHALSGEHWQGDWEDVGTPERLAGLNERLFA